MDWPYTAFSLSIALSVIGACAASPAPQSTVPLKRLDALSRGANVTRWFCYVYGDQDNDDHFAGYMSDAEIAAMRDMGLKHVRLCIAPERLYNPEKPAEPDKRMLAHIDKAIARFNKHDLAVVVDIHNGDQDRIEHNAKWSEGFVTFWGALAKHLSATSPDKVLLEIVNEPVFSDHEKDWYALQERIVSAIRKGAPKHTIVCTGTGWGGIDGLLKLKPVADKNVVYSFHFYDPFAFTHQGATWAGRVPPLLKGIPYPSSPEAVAAVLAATKDEEAKGWIRDYGDKRWNRNKLAERFDIVQAWGKTNGVPLYCGEFGVYPLNAPPADRARWFADLGAVLGKRQIGWAAWGWDDGFSFGRQWVNGGPQIDSVPIKPLGLKPPKPGSGVTVRQ
jgi:endoglucanase